MGKILGLHHLCVNTVDIDKSLEFYCDLLGFKVLDRTLCRPDATPGGFYPLDSAMIRLGNCTIELLSPNNKDMVKVNVRGIIDHFGLEVDNFDEVVADLRAKGAPFTSDKPFEDTMPLGGLKAISMTGPSGECVSLYKFNQQI